MLFLALAAPAQVHREDMDPTCKPCTDFWRYVNGGWLDKNPIPADKASWGTFSVLADANRERIRTILDAAAGANAAAGSISAAWAISTPACMNTAAIDARGYAPLQPDFDRIAAIKTRADLMRRARRDFKKWVARSERPTAPSSAHSASPPGRIRRTRTASSRASSNATEPDVTALPSSRSPTAIITFATTINRSRSAPRFSTMPRSFSNWPELRPPKPPRRRTAILDFEKTLAPSVMTIAEKRDPDKVYHPMDLAALKALAPNVDWGLPAARNRSARIDYRERLRA